MRGLLSVVVGVLMLTLALGAQGNSHKKDRLPSVSITSPASGTVYMTAQTVTITVSASDDRGVVQVEFFDSYNGMTALRGTDTTAPYIVEWTVASVNNGTHTWTARATDTGGQSRTSTAITLTVNIVDQAPPPPPPSLIGAGPSADIHCPAGALTIQPGQDVPAVVDAYPTGTAFCLQVGSYYPTRPIRPKTGDSLTGEYGADINCTNVVQTWDVGGIACVSGWNGTATDVVIRNLTIHDLPLRAPWPNGSAMCIGASGSYPTMSITRWIVDHNDVYGCHQGVNLGQSSGHVISYNTVHGVTMAFPSYRMYDSDISYNDIDGISEHESKWVDGWGIRVTHNRFTHYAGSAPVVWLDTVGGLLPNSICDNWIETDSSNWAAIMVEANTKTEVCRNTILGGNTGTMPVLFIPDSQDTYVHDNIFDVSANPDASGAVAIFWDGQARDTYDSCSPTWPSGCNLTVTDPPAYVSARNRIVNNTFILPVMQPYRYIGFQCSGQTTFQYDGSTGPLLPVTEQQCADTMQQWGNTFDLNSYQAANPTQLLWYNGGGGLTWSQWQAAGYDIFSVLRQQ